MDRYTSNNIRPFKSYAKAEPVYQKKQLIGENGKFFTVVSVRILKPTIQFPETSINLSFSNGNAYCFSKVSPEDLDNLILTLSEWRDAIKNVVSQLEPLEKALIQQRDEAAKLGQMLEIARLNNQNHQETVEPEYTTIQE